MSALDFLLEFRKFSAKRGSVSIMYSNNAKTSRYVSNHLKVLRSDPEIHNLLAMRKWIFSAILAPWRGGFWGRMLRTINDVLRWYNECTRQDYDEFEVSLIETQSVVNSRPLNYVAEENDDPLPITPNKFFNTRCSNCTPSEPTVNLVTPDATNTCLMEMDRQRREYVSDIYERFMTDFLLQINEFHCKRGHGHKIGVVEVVIIHDYYTKCLMGSGKRVDHQQKWINPFSDGQYTEWEPDQPRYPISTSPGTTRRLTEKCRKHTYVRVRAGRRCSSTRVHRQSGRAGRAVDHEFWWRVHWKYFVSPATDDPDWTT